MGNFPALLRFSLLIGLVLLALLAGGPRGAVLGHGIVDQTLIGDPACNSTNFKNPASFTASDVPRQEFVPSQPSLVAVDLCLYIDAGVTAKINVRSGTAASPGDVLASASAVASATGDQFFHFDLPSPLSVTVGTKLVLEIESVGVYYWWRSTCAEVTAGYCPAADPDLYPQGQAHTAGAYEPAGDFAFRTFGGEAPTPLPVKEQLGGCLEVANIAWGLNNQSKHWASFDPDLPAGLQGLTEFAPGGGYFLNTSADCTIDAGVNDVSIYAGWNLFGWRDQALSAEIISVECGDGMTLNVRVRILNPAGITSYEIWSTWGPDGPQRQFTPPLPTSIDTVETYSEGAPDTVDRAHQVALEVETPDRAQPFDTYHDEPNGRCPGHYSGQAVASSTTTSVLGIRQQLGDCLAKANIAWGLNNQSKQWASFDPDLPDILQGLTEFMPGGGYFLNTSADCTIDAGANDVSIYTGWNLFGWR